MAENNNLAKVSISAFEDENFRIKAKVDPNPFFLPVNPEGFTQSYTVETLSKAEEENSRRANFAVEPPQDLRLNFLIDGTNTIEGYRYNGKDHTVQGQLEMFLDTLFDRKGKTPYFLKVEWGKFIFPCILGKLDLDYMMFEPNGDPLRIYVRTVFLYLPLHQNKEEKGLPDKFPERIQNIRFPGKQIQSNYPLKPPLLNLPIVNPRSGMVKTSERKPVDGETINNQNKLSCPNAGVVLLHPFLNHCFGRLHLLDGNNFGDTNSQKQAVLFIHYLATGREIFFEREHFIPNLLCGLPPEMEPAENLLLGSGAKEEAMDLLQTAIMSWKALGNTSPANLRQAFLCREGKLASSMYNQKLQMESSTLDVLLDKLPWSLSIIKLPWMENFLSVVWR